MLSPRKVKHRKQFKGRMKGEAQRGHDISFGDYALKAVGCGHMTAQHIEAARIAINRKTRMGKGKGVPEYWVAVIRPGRILYELKGVPEELAIEALRLASFKLPFPTTIVSKSTSI